MPHIHTLSGQHDMTVSAYIFRIIDDTPHVLLHMHKKFGKLLQPGGHVELDETPWQAMAHELIEETGYSLTDLKVLQPEGMFTSLPHAAIHSTPSTLNTHLIDNVDYPHFHTDMAFVFIADKTPAQPPHERESQDLRWLSMVDIERLGADDVYLDTIELCRHAFEITLKDWHPVPASAFDV